MTPEHSEQPTVVIIDDEEVQIMTVHLQLGALGKYCDFTDPRPALEFIRKTPVDAVVLDIGMKHLPVDGIWFLHKLREFDQDLGVVFRTGNEDVAIAQAGIEHRAIDRVIKLSVDEPRRMRAAVQKAVTETRMRRRLNAAAADAEKTRRQLVTTLGHLDDEITVEQLCRTFVQGLTNDITALCGYAELLAQLAQDSTNEELKTLAAKNCASAHRSAERFTSFLSNPYIDVAPTHVATANECVETLEHICQSNRFFGAARPLLKARTMVPDSRFAASPSRILTALRHLLEFCAQSCEPDTVISLSVSTVANRSEETTNTADAVVYQSRKRVRGPFVCFMVQCTSHRITRKSFRDAMNTCADDPRSANLFILSTAVLDEDLSFEATFSRKDLFTFLIYLPISRT